MLIFGFCFLSVYVLWRWPTGARCRVPDQDPVQIMEVRKPMVRRYFVDESFPRLPDLYHAGDARNVGEGG